MPLCYNSVMKNTKYNKLIIFSVIALTFILSNKALAYYSYTPSQKVSTNELWVDNNYNPTDGYNYFYDDQNNSTLFGGGTRNSNSNYGQAVNGDDRYNSNSTDFYENEKDSRNNLSASAYDSNGLMPNSFWGWLLLIALILIIIILIRQFNRKNKKYYYYYNHQPVRPAPQPAVHH